MQNYAEQNTSFYISLKVESGYSSFIHIIYTYIYLVYHTRE